VAIARRSALLHAGEGSRGDRERRFRRRAFERARDRALIGVAMRGDPEPAERVSSAANFS
jgi:hypothetical protein